MSATLAVISSKDVTFLRSNGGCVPTPRVLSSDISSSSDEFYTKVRKPYTITKQREKWTEQEHEKFLEALKLYGRSWRHIKEHIGTKTAIQIRSHAQKFFFKVERGASDVGLNGQVQEIEIPPPRPKRKPNHPYPRKSGNSPSLYEEIGDTCTNPCSTINIKPTACSSLPGIEGLDPGTFEVEHPEKGKPIASMSDKEALKHECPPQGDKFPADDVHEGASCKEKDPLVQTQMGMHADSEESPMEAPTSPDEINPTLHACSDTKVLMCESKWQPESQSGYIHPNREDSCAPPNVSPYATVKTCRQPSHHEGSQSNPACIWMDSLIHYYVHSRNIQTAPYGPAHDPLAFPTSPWQFMQASLMNHPAAFAAATAAAAWAMGGTGAACKGYNGMQPSPEDLNAAAYAAASATATWWAFSRFVPPPLSHQGHHPLRAAMANPFNMPSTKDNTPDQAHFASANPIRAAVAVPSAASAQGPENFKTNTTSTRTLTSDTCIRKSDVCMDNQHQAQENPSTSADELDGLQWKTQEGSSSGSNTPALVPNSRSPSENDNEEFSYGIEDKISLCTTVDDAHKSAFQPLGEERCVNMKHNNKHPQKDLKHGENENGKRFKSGTHDADFRKEVSLQGRKAFEALFTCRTLPQTFSRGGMKEDVVIPKEKAEPSVPVNYLELLQAELMTPPELDGSVEGAMVIEDDEPNSNFFEAFRAEGNPTSLSIKSRVSTSGFSAYKKPCIESRASLHSSTG